ncbi:HNH endonuclease [bacterium]|nr:HNH endonuclease [bacterium]
MTYSEKLKDPRWQKKRLEIFNRDDFKCVLCGDKNTTLHAHHIFYDKGLEPWEYDNQSIQTLCETCHERIHAGFKESMIFLFSVIDSLKDDLRILKKGYHYDVGGILNFLGVNDISVDDDCFDSDFVIQREYNRNDGSIGFTLGF